jgi:hypothetical protein
LTRFPEPSGVATFNAAWSLESTLFAYLFKIGPHKSWRVGSTFVASALHNLMRRQKLCWLTNDLEGWLRLGTPARGYEIRSSPRSE